MTDEHEQGYIEGKRAALLGVMRSAMRDLAILCEASTLSYAQLLAERVEAVAVARALCRAHDLPNDWPDTLNLADIIEKRIARPLVRK